jgi:selenocysteine-specific elongation factor
MAVAVAALARERTPAQERRAAAGAHRHAGGGGAAAAQLRLARPIALPGGEKLVLRRASPAITLAGGALLDPLARRAKRHSAPVLERLAMLAQASMQEIAASEVALGASSSRALAQLLALPPERVQPLLRDLPVTVSQSGEFRPREEKRPVLAPLRDTGLEAALAERFRLAGLTPPLPGDAIADTAMHRASERLLREGVLIRCTDRDKGKELLFHRDAIAEVRRILAPLLKDGLLVTEIAAALGISRKFCMPLLDHLDTVRFTRRVGDRRILH